MENNKYVDTAETKDTNVFMYSDSFGTHSVVVSKSILQKDEESEYVQFPQKNVSAQLYLMANSSRGIVIREEKHDEYEQDIDILTAVWCLETPTNVWLNYKLKDGMPRTIKQTLSKLFVPENITNNLTGRMCWFVNSLCGSSIPVEITVVHGPGEHKKSEFLIPPFPIDKKSEEWIKFKSDIKELDIKIVSRYRF